MTTYTDMETWMLDFADERVFRVWKYKKMFTPLEQDKKYFDQSTFENDVCKFMWLDEVVELPNGRIMFGFKDASTCAMHDHGEFDFEPPIEYMLDGEFAMEYHDGDLKRVYEELGYDDFEEDEDTEN